MGLFTIVFVFGNITGLYRFQVFRHHRYSFKRVKHNYMIVFVIRAIQVGRVNIFAARQFNVFVRFLGGDDSYTTGRFNGRLNNVADKVGRHWVGRLLGNRHFTCFRPNGLDAHTRRGVGYLFKGNCLLLRVLRVFGNCRYYGSFNRQHKVRFFVLVFFHRGQMKVVVRVCGRVYL